jgi:hypothetical protein
MFGHVFTFAPTCGMCGEVQAGAAVGAQAEGVGWGGPWCICVRICQHVLICAHTSGMCEEVWAGAAVVAEALGMGWDGLG